MLSSLIDLGVDIVQRWMVKFPVLGVCTVV